jgi:hypothetical protein
MKYLKLFESYVDRSNYYKLATHADVSNIMNTFDSEFDFNEIETLKVLMNTSEKDDNGEFTDIMDCYIATDEVEVTKYKDEWFVVSVINPLSPMDPKLYICDQFDGVLELFKDLDLK